MKEGDLVWVVDEKLAVQQVKVRARQGTDVCLQMGNRLAVLHQDQCLKSRELAMEAAIKALSQENHRLAAKVPQQNQGMTR